jgi:hypothetical protein
MYNLAGVTFSDFKDLVEYASYRYKIDWAYEKQLEELSEDEKQEACFEINCILEEDSFSDTV